MTTVNSTAELLQVLKTRREYCRAMTQLAGQQQTLIDQNQMPELLQLIAQKQRVIDGLTELGASFGGLANYWKQIRDTFTPELRIECEAILAESEVLLAAALEREAHGTRQLTQRRDQTQQQLRQIGQTIEARTALGAGRQTAPSSFLDVSR
ncbi:hypothetical protein GC176_11255 [bacterium]|nr:hypothetical protein [bacterium]